MDTNVNYQNYSGDLSPYLGKSFNYGQLTQLNSAMGQSAGNQPTFISNGNIYQVKDNGNNTFGLQQIDTVGNRQQLAAQQQYQAQQGSAISTLQTGKQNLSQQYSDLLSTVKGEYQPLINQETATQGQLLAQRGLTPDSALYQQTTQQALSPIYGQEAANAQQIGAGSINDVNTYNQAISAAQQSGAAFGAQLPLQYGSLSLNQQALPYQLALTAAQARLAGGQAQAAPYISTGIPGILFNSGNGNANLLGQSLSPNAIATALKAMGI